MRGPAAIPSPLVRVTTPARMPRAPLVLVTATTRVVDGRSRVHVNEAYTQALVAAGLVPVVLPPVDPTVALAALDDVAGLVLTGGEDVAPRWFDEAPHPATGAPHAARDACELALARAAHARRTPTLAICRGAQVMNVALGGSLLQDIPSQRPDGIGHAAGARRTERVHAVALEPDSRLAAIVAGPTIAANSSHHQAIDRVAPPLRVVATSPDGIVEAVEPTDPAWWMVAVQWHPEELTGTAEDWDRRLFAAFADDVRAAGLA
jgi:putative glutamine amidotransferase